MTAAAKSQYQHFVPQFLLRNFSHPYKPEGPRKQIKRNDSKGMFRGDPVVRNLDLMADPPVICERPVKRILGQMNMYQDTSKPDEEQQHIEDLLSRFESQASCIFRKITKAFENQETGIWVTRKERNIVRKFLFILKYRGSGFHRRFYHEKPEDYDSDDRELLRAYMAEKGFKRPLDVWFNNLKEIIELDMDVEGDWITELPKRMYPEDANWFHNHTESYYMAICTPSDPEDEFILTDNSYNIFEGPNCSVEDENTGEVGGTGYAPLHMFAPISPKLMIVLRSCIFPNPLEDVSEPVRRSRELLRSALLDEFYRDGDKSMLNDLPVTKALNNYSQITNGQLLMLEGDWSRKKEHKFLFSFFPTDSHHVNTINALLLDNCFHSTAVVFESTTSFARTLEWYLTAPIKFGKKMVGVDANLRESTLKKMEVVSRSLGSNKETIWVKLDNPLTSGYEWSRQLHIHMLRRAKGTATGEQDPDSLVVYMMLGMHFNLSL